ncbi:alanine/glycine:cation symporter family protein [Parvularcula oceani]|uniref:alanine/glycine:cation symporter family protein n=1 Tax=Parvularcula oceani TaxID=1247963 RepID=UPI00068D082F|nr:alanine/glycine:cation symporter family protein [Parvularcula oceani]
MEDAIRAVNGLVWGVPMLSLLLGTGLFLTIGLRVMTLRKLPFAVGQLFAKRDSKEEGDVSPFGALMTAMSSTIGTGNIAGVAAAIAIGGPGAVFWMWMTAIVGMATKYAEGVLAVRFRERDANGNYVGGPMYYIKNGMGRKWIWLAVLFAVFGVLASWGTGASIQANSVADVLDSNYGISPILTGAALAIGAGAVILGGVSRIASVASKLVPFMAIAYLGAGLLVILLNFDQIPSAFYRIFARAWGVDAAGTGVAIGLLMLAMQKGVARGIFSNEAGQGSAPIAHAAAKNEDPVNQGIIAMLGTVIDTLIVCTITALIILTSGVVTDACLPSTLTLEVFQADGQPAGCDTGAPLTAAAFDATLSGIGSHIVAISLAVFAFTTILGWSYYGERCCAFLFSEKSILPFKISWIVVVFFGASALALQEEPVAVEPTQVVERSGDYLLIDGEPLEIGGEEWVLTAGAVAVTNGVVTVGGETLYVPSALSNIVNLFWLVADTLTGLMAAPNLIALLLLSPLVFRLTKAYFKRGIIAPSGVGETSSAPGAAPVDTAS